MAIEPKDIEEGRLQDPLRLDGFPALSHFMSEDSDAAIFRKFNRLATRNLLYLQSNLNELESKLEALDKKDAENAPGNPQLRMSARAYDILKTRARQHELGEARAPQGLQNSEREASVASNHEQQNMARNTTNQNAYEQIQLHSQIREALHYYREALIQEKMIRSFSSPSQRAFSTFKKYFDTKRDGSILISHDKKIINYPEDLITATPSEDDRLNRFLRYTCGYFLRDRERQPQSGLGIFYFSEKKIKLLGYAITIVLCGILLVGAMACLGALNRKSWQLRIGMVALFTFLFAAFIFLLTNARRAEIFASSAAYAAVLVVFVSVNLGPWAGGNANG